MPVFCSRHQVKVSIKAGSDRLDTFMGQGKKSNKNGEKAVCGQNKFVA